jgi:hypothetical protein
VLNNTTKSNKKKQKKQEKKTHKTTTSAEEGGEIMLFGTWVSNVGAIDGIGKLERAAEGRVAG